MIVLFAPIFDSGKFFLYYFNTVQLMWKISLSSCYSTDGAEIKVLKRITIGLDISYFKWKATLGV